jgi:hypothetical protein
MKPQETWSFLLKIVEARYVLQVKLLLEQRHLFRLLFVHSDVVVWYLAVILSKYGEQNIKQTEDSLAEVTYFGYL